MVCLFRDAYKITGRLVAECIDKGLTLETLPLESYRELSELFEDDIYTAISLETCVRERKSFGGPAPESVIKQIEITKNNWVHIMSKKHVVFIVLLTVAAMLVWILGEILIIAVLKLGGKASIIWSIIMILVIIAISMWRCF